MVNGFKTMKERADESRKLLEWGFRAFETRALFRFHAGTFDLGLTERFEASCLFAGAHVVETTPLFFCSDARFFRLAR